LPEEFGVEAAGLVPTISVKAVGIEGDEVVILSAADDRYIRFVRVYLYMFVILDFHSCQC
jgi:hypothetical protein